MINAAAEGAGVPPDYVFAPLIAAVSALVGNARAVTPWRGWIEPAVIWSGSVGDPSSGKSPGADPLLVALREVEKIFAEGTAEKIRDWEGICVAARATRDLWEAAVKVAVKAGQIVRPTLA